MKKPMGTAFGSKRGTGTLGTFAGVFTPSVLTILGIILFRRLGFVVGAGGLGRALLIIATANAISVLTSVSLAAVATNFRVRAGGDYYLISRTLGVEFGGAIGVVLFLAQSVSVAFYCIGFGEAMAGILPFAGEALPRMVAAAAVAVLFLFAWLGADWATRFQYVVMAFLGAALVSFLWGGLGSWSAERIALNWGTPEGAPPFWFVFAIFFPAVTGFTQGVSMSGDLRDPGRSLPLGTFLAVGLSCVVYFGAAVLFAGGLGSEGLLRDYDSMERLARWRPLIQGGVIAATLSSGMASFLGAPRILQALAEDRIFRSLRPFAAGAGPTNNPRRGVLLTAAIALVTIALGNLNVVAPVVSMFFLISYGLLNYATFYEARAASPAFRPRFRWFSPRLSLVGAVGCLGAMLAVNPVAGAVGGALLFSIYHYLKRTAGPARWADGSRAHQFQRVREHLLSLSSTPGHPRDWRPQILALSEADHRRAPLLRFASWIDGGSGLTTAVEIVEGEREERRSRRKEVEEKLAAQIAEEGTSAFPLVVTAPDLRTGIDLLLQSYGIGPLRANILLLHWLEQSPDRENLEEERAYGRHLREGLRLGCHLLVLDEEPEEWEKLRQSPAGGERRIDVWWRPDGTGELMLLLAYLMTRTAEWERARIRVVAPANKTNPEGTAEEIASVLEEARIVAEVRVVDAEDRDGMTEVSRAADIVFVPLRLRGNQPVDPFGEPVEALLEALPVVCMAIAGEEVRIDAAPDEGERAERADARAAADDADREAGKAEKRVEKEVRAVEKAEERVRKLAESEGGDRSALAASLEEASAARAEANRAKKKADAARARAERLAAESGILPPPPPSEKTETDVNTKDTDQAP